MTCNLRHPHNVITGWRHAHNITDIIYICCRHNINILCHCHRIVCIDRWLSLYDVSLECVLFRMCLRHSIFKWLHVDVSLDMILCNVSAHRICWYTHMICSYWHITPYQHIWYQSELHKSNTYNMVIRHSTPFQHIWYQSELRKCNAYNMVIRHSTPYQHISVDNTYVLIRCNVSASAVFVLGEYASMGVSVECVSESVWVWVCVYDSWVCVWVWGFSVWMCEYEYVSVSVFIWVLSVCVCERV